MVSVSLAWAKLARAMSVRAAAISRRMRLVLPLRLPDEWKGPVTRLLSLRRHDPDQVQRVGDAFASQPEAGHPVERAGAYTQAAREWQPFARDGREGVEPGSMTTFTVLLAGDITPTARLAAQIAGTRIIAADSGMRHAAVLGV